MLPNDANSNAEVTHSLRPAAIRESWIDWIRVWGTIAIIVLHVTAREKVRCSDGLSGFDWWTLALYEAPTRIAVPLFFMISGYLVLSRCADGKHASYAFRRTGRTYAVAIFWTLVFSFWEFVKENNDSILSFFPNAFFGQPYYHLWFLYGIAGTYFVAPIIAPGLRALREQYGVWFAWILPAVFSLEFVLSVLNGFQIYYRWSVFSIGIPFLAYTTAGYLLMRPSAPYRRRTGLALCLFGLAATVASYAILADWGVRAPDRMAFSPLAPTIVIMTIGAYLIAANSPFLSRWELPRIGRIFAQDSMGIYILHPFVLDFVYHYRLMERMPGELLGIAIAGTLVTLTTWAVVRIYARFWLARLTISL